MHLTGPLDIVQDRRVRGELHDLSKGFSGIKNGGRRQISDACRPVGFGSIRSADNAVLKQVGRICAGRCRRVFDGRRRFLSVLGAARDLG
jgi:hypothetical protein